MRVIKWLFWITLILGGLWAFVLWQPTCSPCDYQQNQVEVLFRIGGAMGFVPALFFGALWLRLAIFGWLIRFGADNWYEGRDEHYRK